MKYRDIYKHALLYPKVNNYLFFSVTEKAILLEVLPSNYFYRISFDIGKYPRVMRDN